MLSTCKVFATWESAHLDRLADHVVVQTFGANSVLMSRGMPVKKLCIIKRGVLKITKDIVAPVVCPGKDSGEAGGAGGPGFDEEGPGLWVLPKNWKDKLNPPDEGWGGGDMKSFTVGVLGSGQVFGELAVLAPDTPSPTSAVSFTHLEVYCIDSDLILSMGARFNANTINVLNESFNLSNPPVDKISHFHRANVTWENKKKKILNAIVRERPSIAGKLREH